jgi:hypothetical protein
MNFPFRRESGAKEDAGGEKEEDPIHAANIRRAGDVDKENPTLPESRFRLTVFPWIRRDEHF